MNIVYGWKNSLSLFRSQNFKSFMEDVLKNIVATYKLLLHYFWPYFLVIFLGPFFIALIAFILFTESLTNLNNYYEGIL